MILIQCHVFGLGKKIFEQLQKLHALQYDNRTFIEYYSLLASLFVIDLLLLLFFFPVLEVALGYGCNSFGQC